MVASPPQSLRPAGEWRDSAPRRQGGRQRADDDQQPPWLSQPNGARAGEDEESGKDRPRALAVVLAAYARARGVSQSRSSSLSIGATRTPLQALNEVVESRASSW
jgi:hypothetical protein